MSEEGGNTSIAARIAALKLDQVGRQTGDKPAPPKVPNKRPQLPSRPQTTNVPPLGAHASAADAGHDIGNTPASKPVNGGGIEVPPALPNRPAGREAVPSLPPRRPSAQAPQLPPRRPSESPSEAPSRPENSRRLSTESTASALSTRSSISTMSARTGLSSKTSNSGPLYTVRAPTYDPSSLPKLPPKRTPSMPERSQVPLQQSKSSPNVIPSVQEPSRPPLPLRNGSSQSETKAVMPPPSKPQLPSRDGSSQSLTKAIMPPPSKPQLPSRTDSSQSVTNNTNIKAPPPKRSALSWGLNDSTEKPPTLSGRPGPGVPPPIPTGSRPDLSKLLASKPNSAVKASTNELSNGSTPDRASCLKCRDFSAVDAHAARFPRQSIPSLDLDWLAHQLTSPFLSLTEKARAIFTWLHHNIDYNTEALYSGNLKPSTPASTIQTGLAVCEGYASLFTALASKAGLESMVIGGHGKGLGFNPTTPGAALPPEDASGHAWNVVKIDDGHWKLIDPCWGSGHSEGWGKPYKRQFHPIHFHQTNEEFGGSHFPSNKNQFYRTDGRHSITWAEYMLGKNNGRESPQTFGNLTTDEGIDDKSMEPSVKQISISDPRPYVRFQFNKICPHWDNERNGKGKHYVYLLFLPAANGKEQREVTLQTNGQFWWVDIAPRDLGEAGQEIKLAALTSWNDRDGRGIRPDEYDCNGGRSWGFAAVWQLVN